MANGSSNNNKSSDIIREYTVYKFGMLQEIFIVIIVVIVIVIIIVKWL